MNKPRKYSRYLIPLAACLVFIGGCTRNDQLPPPAATVSDAAAQAQNFDDFIQSFLKDQAERSTLKLHFITSNPRAFGLDTDTQVLGSYSEDYLIRRNRDYRELKAALSEFDTASLESDQLLIYRMIEDRLDTELLAEGMELYGQPLSPEDGLQIQIPYLFGEYPFYDTEDVENYLELMSQMKPLYKSLLQFEEDKDAAGLLTGSNSLDMIIQSLDHYMVRPDNNFLTKRFEEKLEDLPKLDEAQKKEYRKRHRDALKKYFIPAYQTLSDGLMKLKGTAQTAEGLASLPRGREYFSYLIKKKSGTADSVETISAEIKQRMQEDLDTMTALSDQHPDFPSRAADYQFAFSDVEEGLLWLRESTKDLFPEIETPCYRLAEIHPPRRAPELQARFAAPAADKPGCGVLYINPEAEHLLTGLAEQGWPGLMYRSAYYTDRQLSPAQIILADPGSADAWALYAGQYAFAEGNGLSEDFNCFLRSYRNASAALYALMDIHLNYDGWSTEQFVEYCSSYGFTDPEVIQQLYCDILCSPGSRAAEYISFMSLQAMREEAEKLLGTGFSLKEFHRFVLDLGPVPHRLMEPYFRAWALIMKH